MKNIAFYKRILVLLVIIMGTSTIHSQVWTLDKCIETAVKNNKRLQMSKNNIEIGRDREAQVKANLMPKIKLEADYKYFIDLPYQLMPLSIFNPQIPEGQFKAAQFGVPHNINTNIQFALPLYNPQIKSKIKNTQIGIEIAELQYQKSEEEIYFDMSNLYYNAQIIRSQIKFVDDNLTNSNKLNKNIQLLYEQTMAKKTDVDKTALQILQLQAKQDILISNYEQILNGMKMLMGISLDENFDVEIKINYYDIVNYSEQRTTDIKLVETKNRLLEGELRTIKKAALPTIMLYGSYGVNGYGYDQSPNEFLDFYPIGFAGLKASYSLFDGKMTKKKKNIKIKELVNTQLQLELLTDRYNLEVTNAKIKIAVSRKAVETIDAQIAFSKSIYDQTVLQQKQGIASITDILLADNDVRESQQNYLSAVVDYLKADLELKKLSGNIINN